MDDEIIVNVNKKKSPNTQSPQNKKKKRTLKKKRVDGTKKNKKINKKIQILGICVILIIAIILILSSSLFNIKNINIIGNEKLSADKIISFSGLQMNSNIFQFNKEEIINNIEENAYIEWVTITRKLPSTVEINLEERVVKYMLQFADSYVYINNQGYMLEISNEKLDVPILVGLTTDLSNIKAGNRINVDDLEKMKMVIKIYEVAKSNEISDLITKIDISNTKNYTLFLDAQNKTVYLGDCSNLNTRILYLKSMLEKTQGQKGELFLNMDLNNEEAYFRETIN